MKTMPTGFTSWQVWQFVKALQDREQDFYEGSIQANIESWDRYELKEVPVTALQNPEDYYLDDYNLEVYAELDLEKMPPIVLGYYDNSDKYLTLDGNHRVAVLQKKNIQTVFAYVAIKGSENQD